MHWPCSILPQRALPWPIARRSDAASGALAEHYALVHDEAYRGYLDELKKARREAMSTADGVKEIMVMRELAEPKTAYILGRGEYNQRRDRRRHLDVPEWLLPLPEGDTQESFGHGPSG